MLLNYRLSRVLLIKINYFLMILYNNFLAFVMRVDIKKEVEEESSVFEKISSRYQERKRNRK